MSAYPDIFETFQTATDIELLYEVKLTLLVGATMPCTRDELAALAQDRLNANRGVRSEDISSFRLLSIREGAHEEDVVWNEKGGRR